MIRRISSLLLVFLLFTAARPCGPLFPTFNLVVAHIPDGTRADWAAGRLGLLQPRLSTADLIIAWRWLSGVGLDAAEQHALLTPVPPAPDGLETWKKARAEAGAAPLSLRTSRTEDYREVPVIGEHALRLAAQVLRQRLARFGKGSPAVRSWLEAQDLVFAWEGPRRQALPAPAGSGLPLQIRQDRAYQQAAAYFYREDYPAAIDAFQAVAADAANPWRGWAELSLARIIARFGNFAGVDLDGEQVLGRLAQLQADPALAELHADAAALENRIRYQLDAPAFYRGLLGHLASKHRGPALVQDVEDLRWLRVLEPWTLGLKDTLRAGVHAWIHRLQEGSLEDTLAAYDAQPDLPNLVAVLMALPKEHPRTETFLNLAQQACRQPGPAYATLVSHRIRILCGQKRLKAAEALADEALAQPGAARWPSAFNLWSSLKLAQAGDVDAFAAHLGRRLASIDDGWTEWSEHPDDQKEDRRALKALDPAAQALLNRHAPLRLWEEILASPRFPADLRPELLEALWTRAAVLEREDVMVRWRLDLAKARPELAGDLAAWAAERRPARRKVLACLLIWDHRLWPQLLTFRQEAFQFGTIFARWEGPEDEEEPPSEGAQERDPRGLTGFDLVLSPAFLDAGALREGGSEAARIPAPLTWFCEQALAFARDVPEDPLAAEALSRAVRSSRNGNRDSRSAGLVVKAFRLLHARYPNTAAARRARIYH